MIWGRTESYRLVTYQRSKKSRLFWGAMDGQWKEEVR